MDSIASDDIQSKISELSQNAKNKLKKFANTIPQILSSPPGTSGYLTHYEYILLQYYVKFGNLPNGF